MSRVHRFARSPWLWITLLVLGLSLAPFLLVPDQEPFGLVTFLSPTHLHQTVFYDEEGNVLHTTTMKAIGDDARLASLAECAEEMDQDQAWRAQRDQVLQEGETFKGQYTCR